MITTKHNLCANTAKLNLNELIETAQIAVARSRWDCESSLQKVQYLQMKVNSEWRETYDVANSADDLAKAAKALAQATNTLHYLIHAQNRETITVDKG